MDDVRVVRPHERDAGTAQTPGMRREAGVASSTVGADALWMGHVSMAPGTKSGAHHHGPVESAIYVISGRARIRFGPRLEQSVDAGPGDFLFVPADGANVVHDLLYAPGKPSINEGQPLVLDEIDSRPSSVGYLMNPWDNFQNLFAPIFLPLSSWAVRLRFVRDDFDRKVGKAP